MFTAAAAPVARPIGLHPMATRPAPVAAGACESASRQVAETLQLLEERLAPKRRVVHAGEAIYRAGARLAALHVLNSRMTRSEIGNRLGMTLATASRALSRLARNELIRFTEKCRRDIQVPDLEGLSCLVRDCIAPEPTMLH